MTRKEALNKAINIVSYFEAHFAKSKEAREDAVNIIEALEQEPCEDAISRDAVCDYIAEFINHEYSTQSECEMVDSMIEGIQHMPPVKPQEPQTDYKAFAEWVSKEIFDDNWEYNKESFAEIACRKLAKLGIVARMYDEWVLMERSE